MRRRPFLAMLVLSLCLVLPGHAHAKKLKVAFALLESVNDQGWSQSHSLGIEQLKAALGDQIEVSYTENVKVADAERVFRQYAQDGYDMIFGTTFEHMEPLLLVAKEYPDIAFEHCSGYKTAPNLGTYMGAMEQAEYLGGYMAGLMGYKNVGTVATFPIPEPVRGINAFTLGLIRGLNESGAKFDPEKVNTVAWLKKWRDPVGETAMAETLVQNKHDLIRQMADTPDSSLAACAKNVPAVGYGADAAKSGAKCALVSTLWNWGPFYIQAVKAKLNGTWKAEEWYHGFEADAVALSPFGDQVPQEVRTKVLAEMERMKKGEDNSFAGPVFDQAGKQMIAPGDKANLKELLTMRWLVKGVSGAVPE
ncbi:BMP family ABC transporter substrate-binding protein [Fundidesulfovibrio butyratiphilus]